MRPGPKPILWILVALTILPSGTASDASDEDDGCWTVSVLSFDELVIAPVLGDAVGVTIGTSTSGHAAGVTVLVRPSECGNVGNLGRVLDVTSGSANPHTPWHGRPVPLVP